MSKNTKPYFYHYSYEDGEQAIATTLFHLLFPQQIYESYFFSDITYDPNYCVHLHYRIDLLCRADSLEELIINAQQLPLTSFHLQYLTTTDDFTYPQRLTITKHIAELLPGTGQLTNAVDTLYWGYHDQCWFIGHKHENHYAYRIRKQRPFQYSNALPTRLCHSIMVLIDQSFIRPSIIDPCCGVGTLLIEGLIAQQRIKGYEINPLIAQHGNANLQHFGLPPVIEIKDMTSSDEHFDLVIMDIPYGHYNPFEYQSQQNLLSHCPQLAPFLLLISLEDPKTSLNQLGYQIIMQTSTTKAKFTRLITLAKI